MNLLYANLNIYFIITPIAVVYVFFTYVRYVESLKLRLDIIRQINDLLDRDFTSPNALFLTGKALAYAKEEISWKNLIASIDDEFSDSKGRVLLRRFAQTGVMCNLYEKLCEYHFFKGKQTLVPKIIMNIIFTYSVNVMRQSIQKNEEITGRNQELKTVKNTQQSIGLKIAQKLMFGNDKLSESVCKLFISQKLKTIKN